MGRRANLTAAKCRHAQQRISYVARGIWHHPHCPAGGDCELVGFHTATPAELVDEYAATREEAEGRRVTD